MYPVEDDAAAPPIDPHASYDSNAAAQGNYSFANGQSIDISDVRNRQFSHESNDYYDDPNYQYPPNPGSYPAPDQPYGYDQQYGYPNNLAPQSSFAEPPMLTPQDEEEVQYLMTRGYSRDEAVTVYFQNHNIDPNGYAEVGLYVYLYLLLIRINETGMLYDNFELKRLM